MTDSEVDILVAEKVMGWHRGGNPPSGWFDAQDFMRPAENWKPSTDMEAARLVVEKMAADGFWVSINGPFAPGQPYWVGFSRHNDTGWKDRPEHQSYDLLLPRAICLAALAARIGNDMMPMKVGR